MIPRPRKSSQFHRPMPATGLVEVAAVQVAVRRIADCPQPPSFALDGKVQRTGPPVPEAQESIPSVQVTRRRIASCPQLPASALSGRAKRNEIIEPPPSFGVPVRMRKSRKQNHRPVPPSGETAAPIQERIAARRIGQTPAPHQALEGRAWRTGPPTLEDLTEVPSVQVPTRRMAKSPQPPSFALEGRTRRTGPLLKVEEVVTYPTVRRYAKTQYPEPESGRAWRTGPLEKVEPELPIAPKRRLAKTQYQEPEKGHARWQKVPPSGLDETPHRPMQRRWGKTQYPEPEKGYSNHQPIPPTGLSAVPATQIIPRFRWCYSPQPQRPDPAFEGNWRRGEHYRTGLHVEGASCPQRGFQPDQQDEVRTKPDEDIHDCRGRADEEETYRQRPEECR